MKEKLCLRVPYLVVHFRGEGKFVVVTLLHPLVINPFPTLLWGRERKIALETLL